MSYPETYPFKVSFTVELLATSVEAADSIAQDMMLDLLSDPNEKIKLTVEKINEVS